MARLIVPLVIFPVPEERRAPIPYPTKLIPLPDPLIPLRNIFPVDAEPIVKFLLFVV